MGHSITSRRPIVTLASAISLDGKIATKTGESEISSPRDSKTLHRLRSRNDAVMIGVGTALRDDPRLTVRLVKGRNPVRIIVDSAARTPPQSRIFMHRPSVIVAVSRSAPKRRTATLERVGAKIIRTGGDVVDLRVLLSRLYRMGIRRLLLEGGGKLNWSMISKGFVDNISVTVAPIVIGGSQATTLVEGIGVGKVCDAITLKLTKGRRFDDEIVLTYKLRKRRV